MPNTVVLSAAGNINNITDYCLLQGCIYYICECKVENMGRYAVEILERLDVLGVYIFQLYLNIYHIYHII